MIPLAFAEESPMNFGPLTLTTKLDMSLDPPKLTFSEDHILAPMGSCPFKLYSGSLFCQAYVHKSVMMELKRVIEDSEIMEEDDALWPPPDRVGRQVSSVAFSFVYNY